MRYNINLIPPKESSWGERLVYFALNYLRYIIVITQLVVLGVFFYRFQVDQAIIDLKEGVDQKKEIIQVVSPLLSQAEIINRQVIAAEKIMKKQNHFSQMINYLISLFPASVKLTSLEIDEGQIKMQGLTSDISQFQSFYHLLKKERKFEMVNIENIKKEGNMFVFNLNLTKFKQ